MANEKTEVKKTNQLTWYHDGVSINGWSMRLSNVPKNLKKTGLIASSLVANSYFHFFNTTQADRSIETANFASKKNQAQYKCDFTLRQNDPLGSIPPSLDQIYQQLLNSQLCNATAVQPPPDAAYDLIRAWTYGNNPEAGLAVQFWHLAGAIKDVDLERCINETITQGVAHGAEEYRSAAGFGLIWWILVTMSFILGSGGVAYYRCKSESCCSTPKLCRSESSDSTDDDLANTVSLSRL